jgi:hypothetical protein
MRRVDALEVRRALTSSLAWRSPHPAKVIVMELGLAASKERSPLIEGQSRRVQSLTGGCCRLSGELVCVTNITQLW